MSVFDAAMHLVVDAFASTNVSIHEPQTIVPMKASHISIIPVPRSMTNETPPAAENEPAVAGIFIKSGHY